MEIEKIAEIEHATWAGRRELFRLGTALLFIVAVVIYVGSLTDGVSNMLVVAAMIGGYMALNIGANDVANNVGPAVGSKALTMTGAILIAVVFEASGALIAGGDVVGTIKSGIIDPALIPNTDTFVWVMTAALLAGALWLNLATVMGAPVSTTHSIVGGVLGAGIAAGGMGIADWGKVTQIVISWLISPAHGGTHCRTVSVSDKAHHHVQGRSHRCCETSGTGADRVHGMGIWNLHCSQGTQENLEDRFFQCTARRSCPGPYRSALHHDHGATVSQDHGEHKRGR